MRAEGTKKILILLKFVSWEEGCCGEQAQISEVGTLSGRCQSICSLEPLAGLRLRLPGDAGWQGPVPQRTPIAESESLRKTTDWNQQLLLNASMTPKVEKYCWVV